MCPTLCVASGARATGDTLFRIASNTKIFTDLAAIRAVSEAGYNLDTPVVQLESRFKVQDPFPGGLNGADITLHHLGTHMSGLYDTAPCARDTLGSACTTADVFNNLPKTQLALPVGFRPAYSNLGFSLLGSVCEPLMKMSYARYVTEKILRPFGMNSSTFNVSDPNVVARMAKGGGKWSKLIEMGFSNPAGGLVSSTND